MMKDMLDEQQVGIDILEKQMDETRDNVQEGNKEMGKAIQAQSASRTWMCYGLAAMVALLLVILIPVLAIK